MIICFDASLDGNQDLGNTDLHEKTKEKGEEKKKKRKKKNFIPAVTSMTSFLVPSGALASLGRSKKKGPHGIFFIFWDYFKELVNLKC